MCSFVGVNQIKKEITALFPSLLQKSLHVGHIGRAEPPTETLAALSLITTFLANFLFFDDKL